MRLSVIGRPEDRDRLRQELRAAGIDVDGEFDTLDEARRHAGDVDGFVIASDHPPPDSAYTPEEPLTAREREVLELLVQGLPNKAIAAPLGISDQTVKFHVAAICGKLGAINRTDAVRRAIRRGLVSV
jgi:DNA-binding NarL/FixJ family response regulator